jgi:drug/metabolite transporter (DMT)-like permease
LEGKSILRNKPPHGVPPKLALLFGILAVSTAAIFIRFAQENAPSLAIAVYRLAIATLLLTPFAIARNQGELRTFSRADVGLLCLSGIFLAVHFATWITSLEYTTVASSVVLVTTTPLWVALFSPLFLKERLSRWVVAGMLVAFVGGIVIGISDACGGPSGRFACPPVQQFFQGKAFLGDFLALAGAWAAAGYILIGRRMRAGVSLLSYTFVVYGVSALVLVFLAMFTRTNLVGYPGGTMVLFFALAIVPQLLGHSTFNWALKHLSAALVSISLLGEPVGSTVLAYFILNEIPSPIKLLGAALILTGIYLAVRAAPK